MRGRPLPADFDWRIYSHPIYNPDVARVRLPDEASVRAHYQQDTANRVVASYDKADPLSLWPADFNWRGYLDNNPHLYSEGVKTEKAALHHWAHTGRFHALKYQSLPPNRKAIIILSHHGGGGMSRHACDLIEHLLTRPGVDQWDILSNEDRYQQHPKIQHWTSHYLLSFLLSPHLLMYDQVIVHIHTFSRYYYLIRPDEYVMIVKAIRRVVRSRVILTVHDFSLLWPSNYAPVASNLLTDNVEPERINQLCKLTNGVDQCIFPSEAVLKVFKARGVTIRRPIVNNHPDFAINTAPYVHRSEPLEPLRILYLGVLQQLKGYDMLLHALYHNKWYDTFEVHFVGSGTIYPCAMGDNVRLIYHGKYTDNTVAHLINDIRPHLCILGSICLETWGYTTTILLSTGLPLLYNQDVYDERVGKRSLTYPYIPERDKLAAALADTMAIIRRYPVQSQYRPLDLRGGVRHDGLYEDIYI